MVAAKQDLSALASDNVYGGWVQIPEDTPVFSVVNSDIYTQQTGKTNTFKDFGLLSRPVAVNPSGYVLFSDGVIYRPASDDFLTLDGRIFDRNANCTGVIGPRQDPIFPIAKPAEPTNPADAAQDDLLGEGQGGNLPGWPSSPLPSSATHALSLYQLLQTSDAQVHNVRVADILVNVDVKQFKSGARLDNGVVPGEELHGEFQKIPAKPIVVLQKLDGSLEVVTGRHRLDLAKRNGLETIPANIIREADGWTPESAALLDAFDNILDEKGSYADYVPFFRKAGIPRDVAEAYGLLARPKGRLSYEIAMNATDDLVSFVAAGDKRVTPDVAAAICRAVPVPAAAREAGVLTGQAARYDAIQHYVMRAVIDEGLRADQAEIMANGIRAEYAKRAEANTIQQDDLFGADETFNTEMALRAKYAGDQLAKINLDLRALKIVSGKQSGNVAAKDALLKKYNIKGPDDTAGIERAIQELETLHHRWQHYYTDAELSKEADAFVKKSLRLDPEDQPPIPLDPKGNPITPEPAPATSDELPLGSPAAQPAAPNGARPETSAQTSVSTPEVARNERKQAESDAARKERQARRAAQRARMVTAEDLGVGGLTDEQGNGPDFMPVRPEESESTIKGETLAKRKLKPDTNVRLGFDFHIDARDDALKIAKFTSSGEDGSAHRYAARNIIPLVKRAGVAVRQKNYNDTTDSRVSKEFERLFIPYFFEGRLYVAVVSQRYQDVRGVHALETLDVFRAETRPEVSSDESKGSERPTGGFHALNTITIPNEGPNDNTLSLASIQRVIDNPKKGGNQNPRLLDPDGNGGLTETPCTAQDVADRIVADVADFVGRARYRADHILQPVDAEDGGRFTMGEGVTVEVSDGVATVAGLAGKAPAEAAKILDAIQAQLPPNVSISTDATPVARQGVPESPASPESPVQSGGNAADAPLANQAPSNQAPAQSDARSPGDPFSVLRSPFSIANGADIVSAAVYPNGGRVPVAGSPAAAAGTLPLSLPHAVQLFHLLTGKLPGVVAQKNRGPRNALGWFLPKTGDAFVRAQLFGLIDQSDLTVLKDGLAKRGYFRHEDPAWCVTQTKDSIRREKALSNQKLAKAADLLVRRRTRAGVHQGAAAKVMAHELWHAISASGGVPPRDHGNLLGQIYNLKKCMANALPENTFATDDVLRQEAKDFIIWWRGVGHHEPYFEQPHEAYAEMGAAFFLDPEAVRERAPTYYNAMLDGLRNYPQAFDALAAIRDQRAAGGDLDAFQQRLQTTWQAAHDARLRKLRDEVGKPTRDERNARIVQLLWNRHAPVMLILQRAQEDVRRRLHQDLKAGNITQADHDARIHELDEEQLDVRHHTLLFTHLPPKSRQSTIHRRSLPLLPRMGLSHPSPLAQILSHPPISPSQSIPPQIVVVSDRRMYALNASLALTQRFPAG